MSTEAESVPITVEATVETPQTTEPEPVKPVADTVKPPAKKVKLKRDPSTGRFASKPGVKKPEVDYMTIFQEHSNQVKAECKSLVEGMFQQRQEEKRLMKEKAKKYAEKIAVPAEKEPVPAKVQEPSPPEARVPVLRTSASSNKHSWYKNQIFS